MDSEPISEVQRNPATVVIKTLADRGCEIIPPPKYELPTDYNTSRFKKDQRLIDRTIEVLTGYLNYAIIKDNFKEHEDRTKWRLETGQLLVNKYGPEALIKFEEILRENKMKRNAVQKIIGFVDLIRDHLPEELADQIIFMQDRVKPDANTLPQWNGPTTPEKIKIVEEFSDNIVKALHYLAGTSQGDAGN